MRTPVCLRLSCVCVGARKKAGFSPSNLLCDLDSLNNSLRYFPQAGQEARIWMSGVVMQVVSLCKCGLDRRHTKGSAAWGYAFCETPLTLHWRNTKPFEIARISKSFVTPCIICYPKIVILASLTTSMIMLLHFQNHEEMTLLHPGIWDDSVNNLV